MRVLITYILALRFLINNFWALSKFIILPFVLSCALFIFLLLSGFFLLGYLPNFLNINIESIWAQGLLIGTQVLFLLLIFLTAYFLFIPIWQLCILPFLEDLSLKTCEIYSNQQKIKLKKSQAKILSSFWFSVKISLSIFFRQILFRILILILLFISPAFGLAGIFFEFLANYLFASYDYFYPPINFYSTKIVNLDNLKNKINSLGIPIRQFKFWAAIFLSIPILNIFFLFINIICSSILFCEAQKNK